MFIIHKMFKETAGSNQLLINLVKIIKRKIWMSKRKGNYNIFNSYLLFHMYAYAYTYKCKIYISSYILSFEWHFCLTASLDIFVTWKHIYCICLSVVPKLVHKWRQWQFRNKKIMHLQQKSLLLFFLVFFHDHHNVFFHNLYRTNIINLKPA